VAAQHLAVGTAGQAIAAVEDLERRERVELAGQGFEGAPPSVQELRSQARQAAFEQADGGALVRDPALGVGAQQPTLDGLQILASARTGVAERARGTLGKLVETLAAVVDESARIAQACARAFESEAARAHLAKQAAPSRPASTCTSASNSAATGTASSAAADGVGARTSATKSAMVKSVSCPMAEMVGSGQAAMVRARASSLKAHRSSMEPPPRARMITSTSGTWQSADSAAAMESRGAFALDGCRGQQDGDGKTPVGHAHDVANHGPLAGGDDADPSWKKGQGTLARAIEQALGRGASA
jgi:hypothetical protein